MANIATIDICRKDLFTPVEELQKEYTEAQVARVLRLRDMYNWVLANPDAKDRQFIEEELARGFAVHAIAGDGEIQLRLVALVTHGACEDI